MEISPASTAPEATPTPASAFGCSTKSKLLCATVGLAVLVLVAIASFVLGRALPRVPEGTLRGTPNQILTTPTIDPTANWKTYINTKHGYSIKYPLELTLDASNVDALSIFRKDVKLVGGGMGIGHGMVIYYRTYGAEAVESVSRPTENVQVAGYSAVRWTDNNACIEDIWISNPNKKNAIRMSLTTCTEIEPYNKNDFELFKQILSTFRFD